jgi:hypothetical protein
MAMRPARKTDEFSNPLPTKDPADKPRGMVKKRHEDDEKEQKRFRWEFFSRGKAYQDYKSGKIGPERMVRSFPNFRIFRPLIPAIKELKEGKDTFLNELTKVVAGVPSIEIIYGPGRIALKSVSLNYLASDDYYFKAIDDWRKQYPDQFRKLGRFFSLLKAIDKNDKTILLKIHLDRKKENILKDFRNFLKFIQKEAKQRQFNFRRPRPRWDEYDNHLKVYDLRKKKKSWRQIAQIIFPNDESPDSAMRKVRHHYRQAERMINGGWGQI